MGQTIKFHYDRDTLGFKLQAVKLANHPNVRAKATAELLGIHSVMLYRRCMEFKNRELRENKHMKAVKASSEKRGLRRANSTHLL